MLHLNLLLAIAEQEELEPVEAGVSTYGRRHVAETEMRGATEKAVEIEHTKDALRIAGACGVGFVEDLMVPSGGGIEDGALSLAIVTAAGRAPRWRERAGVLWVNRRRQR